MFIDTHAHLNFKAFKNDYKDAIGRAFDANVKGIINVGSNLETSEKAIEIAHQYEKGVYAAVSLHPVHVLDEKFAYDKYLALAKDEKVVALGETGIDLYHDKKTIDLQREVFKTILEIAQEVNKPVILHCRGAQDSPFFIYDELLNILTPHTLPHKPIIKGVIHCFGGSLGQALKFIKMGFYIGFTGIVTYKNAEVMQDVTKNIPLEKILIETDSPYLAPQKYRGARNEPAYVIEVAKKIAEIKKISLEKVEEITTKNAIKLFNLSSFNLL
ncbi:MAG: TatD family hydrolase [Patescibacteria group bacterium]|nr:TatD family hydrolase [Patescibacteria group bacterium]